LPAAVELPLVGPGGEPVDFARTHMFRLDEDLSGFYERLRDGDLAWCNVGPGAWRARRPYDRELGSVFIALRVRNLRRAISLIDLAVDDVVIASFGGPCQVAGRLGLVGGAARDYRGGRSDEPPQCEEADALATSQNA